MINLRELRLAFNNLDHYQDDLSFLKPLGSKLIILELSYSLKRNIFPKVLKQMKSLEFLEIDHNNLKSISSQTFKGLRFLVHLDLESNEIESLGPDWLKRGEEKDKLRNILLSRNRLISIKSYTFDQLQVVNIVLLANRLKSIEKFSFNNLASLQTLVLSSNQIESIDDQAFHNCSRLTNILLQDNRLTSLSFNLFQNIKPTQPTPNSVDLQEPRLFINASNNHIQRLIYNHLDHSSLLNLNNLNLSINVKTLDLSYNLIDTIDDHVIKIFGPHLASLYLSFNKIRQLDWLKHCPQLLQLYLDHNEIDTLNLTIGQHSDKLIILDLSSNHISTMSQIMFFKSMFSLKYLDLSFNQIDTLGSLIWSNLSLENLNLSYNQLTNDKATFEDCLSLSLTLKSLDVSGNLFQSVPFGLSTCTQLVQLVLQNNHIQTLNEQSFQNLNHLQLLDLSNNRLKHFSPKSFMSLTNLHTLKLNNASLTNLPLLHLNHLTNLELSSNHLSDMSSKTFLKAVSIKRLDLSNNRLPSVPKHLWRHISGLTELNLANNSIDVLDLYSFADLKHLNSLDICGLNLKHIDLRVLSPLK